MCIKATYPHLNLCWHATVAVEAPVSSPLPLPIVLPLLTVAAPGEQTAPTGMKVQQLGLASWNLDRIDQRVRPGFGPYRAAKLHVVI